MSTNIELQPINLAEERVLRDGCILDASRQRAYRQLAIAALGLDVPTLTRSLRARRLQAMPTLVVPQPALGLPDLAA